MRKRKSNAHRPVELCPEADAQAKE